jgi:hypothetical protein
MQDFEIDEESQEYLQYHPQTSKRDPSSLIEEHFELATDDEDDDQLEPGSSDVSEADESEAKRSKPVRCVFCDFPLLFVKIISMFH